MNQRDIRNGVGDAVDQDGGEVTALLRALPRVEAPTNFEFGVKARIAGREPRSAGFIPFLKVAAPLSLVFAVAGFGIFYGTLTSDTGDNIARSPESDAPPVVAPRIETPVALPPQTAAGPQVKEPAVVQPQRASAETERRGPVRRSSNSSTSVESSEGGSRVFMLESANTKNPRGLEINPVLGNRNSNSNARGAQIPVRDVFGMLGVNADFVDGGWKVRSVTENSIASRAKVQAGDVIEAIDGQPLKDDWIPKGTAAIATIRRDGKTINLNLK